MLVVKTTSPATSPPPAKLRPSKTAPSSRTTVALLPCSKLRPDSVVDHLSANYSTHDPARQPPPEVGGVRGPAQQRTPVHPPLLGEVHEREVRWSTDADAPTPEIGRAHV